MVIIKVAIGLKSSGKHTAHSYPDFNSIRSRVGSWNDNTDWSVYIDRYGGWKYDSICGHSEEDGESPRGCWHGVLVIPNDFAEEALKEFPETVSIIDEAECKKFYEERVTVDQPEIKDNLQILQAIAAKRNAGIPEDADDQRALDPDHPQPGRKRNKLKTWAGYKEQRGIEIDAKATQRLRNNSKR